MIQDKECLHSSIDYNVAAFCGTTIFHICVSIGNIIFLISKPSFANTEYFELNYENI